MALSQEERDALYADVPNFETKADMVKREELQGDPRTPAEQAIDFVSNPRENLLKPISAGSMDFMSGLNTGIAGVARLGAELSTAVPLGLSWLMSNEDEGFFTAEDRTNFIQDNVTQPELARQRAYSQYREELTGNKPNDFMETIGQIFPSLLVNPSKAAPTVIGRMIQAGKYGGASGAMEFTEGGASEIATNTLVGMTLGIGFQGGIDGAVGYKRLREKPTLKKLTVNNPTAEDVLSRAEQSEVLKAAEKLGITITPAEATGDILLIHGQNQIVVNEMTRGELAEFLLNRNDDLTENILNLQRVGDRDLQYTGATFTPASISGAADATPARPPFLGKQDEVRWKKSRQEVYRKTLDQKDLAEVLGASPLLQRQFIKYQRAAKTKPSKRTDAQALDLTVLDKLKKDLGIKGDMPLNNVGFLDMLINNLDQVLDTGAEAGTAAAKSQRAAIQGQRKALSQRLKDKVAGYADVKSQGQRALAVSMLRNAVDETTTAAGDYAETFYKNVLRDKKKREELISILKANDPEAASHVADLGLVMSHIFSDANLAKKIKQVSGDIATESTGGAGTVSSYAPWIVKGVSALKKDEGMIRVLTDPRWASSIKDLRGRTPDETFLKLANLLTTATNTSNYIEQMLDTQSTAKEEKASQPRTSKNPVRPQSSRQPLGLFGKNI
tara:strand:+ start:733 stop:2748 length:2016 start_codon:yes stop_codon:yes gene_type:complete